MNKINEAARQLGKRGGAKTLKLYGPEHYKQMAAKSNRVQKERKKGKGRTPCG